MIMQKKLNRQIKLLKARKTCVENELDSMAVHPVPNDMARHRLQADIRRLDDEIKTLESKRIPDIIA